MTGEKQRRRFRGEWVWYGGSITATAVLSIFIFLPLLALVITIDLNDFWTGLTDPLVWQAMRLSLFTSLISLIIVILLGTPLAWHLACSTSRFAKWLETLLKLPVVIPPAVAGLGLLLAFSRRGLLGPLFDLVGWSPALTPVAVIMAQVFVSAPFHVQAATTAFRRMDDSLLVVARSLGASPFRTFLHVALPIAAPSLLSGAAMSWSRALGEFGATLMFAGNLAGRTQTMPLAIYVALESNPQAAQALAIVLTLVAFLLLLALRSTHRYIAIEKGDTVDA